MYYEKSMGSKMKDLFQGGLYRSRDGVILGVCKGISEYFDFSLFWIRAIMILLFLISGFWPLTALYFIAALLMKPKPVVPIDNDEEQEFYESYVNSRKGAVDRVKRRFQNLDRRIQRMEHTVTAKEYDWERRFNSGEA
jgi:phage shock protein C